MNNEGKFTVDSPRFQAIKAVIESKQGKQLAIDAANNGVPPLCALDQILRETIVAYNSTDFSTHNAGWIIADMMRSLGYTENGTGHCYAEESVAKTGLLWKPKVSE